MLEHDIPDKNRERVYDIEPRERGKSIVITVPSKPAEYVAELLSRPDIPIISDLQEKLKLPDFINPQNPEWGFGPALETHVDTGSNEVSWVCALPKYEKMSGDQWEIPFATSATLQVTFMALGMKDSDGKIGKNQLLHIQLTPSINLSNGPIVTLGRSIIPWLSSLPNEHFHQGIQGTMRVAYEQMAGRVDYSPTFKAWFRQPKWVNLDCPGNACGLDPESYRNKDLDIGYRLLPHNVDTPYQQLTLLAGVASMHKEARDAGY